MKRRRRYDDAAFAEAEPAGVDDGAMELPEVEVSTGVAALTATAARWAAWTAIIAGPVLGATALALALSSAPQPTAASPQASGAVTASRPTAPAGFAELYVTAYLEAGEGSTADLAAFYPAADDLRLQGKPNARHVEQVATTQARELAPGYWSITVTARIDAENGKDTAATDRQRRDAVRYFQVPVVTDQQTGAAGGPGCVAAALPAEIAPPQAGQTPRLAYGQPAPPASGDAAGDTVQQFLNAYLAGQGELSRYLAPGTRIRPVKPAPYEGVTVTQIAAATTDLEQDSPQVPADGTRRRLLVDVDAHRADEPGQPLTYAVTIAARAGRWEVAGIDPAPLLIRPQAAASGAATPNP